MRSSVRVVIVPSWYPSHADDSGGVFFREQGVALVKAGLDVAVVSPLRRSIKAGTLKHSPLEPWPGLLELRGGYFGPPRMPRLDAMIWRSITRRLFAQYVEARGVPDIVHAHSLFPAGAMALELPARRHIITEHATAFLTERAGAMLKPYEGKLSQYARRIAVSRQYAESLERLAPESGPWTYVPNLVDTRFFRPSGRSSNRVRILTLSNLRLSKRVDWVIRSFDRVFPSGDAELRIGGDGEERGRLEALVSTLRSRSRIRFLGPLSRDEVREHMDDCSFFALASKYETFGVVLIEALSMGKPVLATDSCGPASIIDRKNGFITPLHDEAAFAAAMARLAGTLEKYRAIEIRADCEARFGETAVTSTLTRIYEEALALGR